MCMPSSPSSASLGTSSTGKTASSNHSAIRGLTSESTNDTHGRPQRLLVVGQQRVDGQQVVRVRHGHTLPSNPWRSGQGATAPAARRPRGRRPEPGAGRPDRGRHARRPGRTRHQGRATGHRRRHPRSGDRHGPDRRARTSRARTAASSRSPSTSAMQPTSRTAVALVDRADIVIENYRSGALERHGLDAAAVARAQPARRVRLDHRVRQRSREPRFRATTSWCRRSAGS